MINNNGRQGRRSELPISGKSTIDSAIKLWKDLNVSKSSLSYSEIVCEISMYLPPHDDDYQVRKMIPNLFGNSVILKMLRDLLIYLRDERTNEVKNMQGSNVFNPADSSYKTLIATRIILKSIKCIHVKCMSMRPGSLKIDSQFYPYFHELYDVLVILIHRHLKKIYFKYKDLHTIDDYKMNVYISMTPFNFENITNITTAHFGGPLTAHFGTALKDKVQEVYRHLRSVDNEECVICGDEIREDSDFAVLDTCNHFMCTDCAEVALMGRVFDVVPNPPELLGGHEVELSKVPKCPCCRRQVKEWTTSYHIKFLDSNNVCGIFCRDRCQLLSNNNVSKTENYVTPSATNVSETEKTSSVYFRFLYHSAIPAFVSFVCFSHLFFKLVVIHT